MSKQDPTSTVFRNDEGIASDSLAILRSVQPLLKALSETMSTLSQLSSLNP
jgi:hypothetical protein